MRNSFATFRFFLHISLSTFHKFSHWVPLSNFDHPNFSLTLCFSYSYTLYFKCGIQLRMKYTRMMACIELPCMKIRDIQKSINIFKSKTCVLNHMRDPIDLLSFYSEKMSTKGKENLLYTCYFYCEAHQMSSFVIQG